LWRAFSPAADVIPELKATAWAGATVAHQLDMRWGVAFDQDYLAKSGPIIAYRKSTGWDPLEPGEAPSDLCSHFHEMRQLESALPFTTVPNGTWSAVSRGCCFVSALTVKIFSSMPETRL
jgi:hypothetical protein